MYKYCINDAKIRSTNSKKLQKMITDSTSQTVYHSTNNTDITDSTS